MIQAIKVTNYQGESLTIKLTDSEPTSGLLIKEITGLGSPKATIATVATMADGEQFSYAKTEKRTIGITFLFTFAPDVETARYNTYRYFPLKKKLRLDVITDKRVYWIEGYVESNEPNIFAQNEETTISIVCDDPYFKDVERVLGRDLVWYTDGSTPSFTLPRDFGELTLMPEARSYLIEYWGNTESAKEYVDNMTDEQVYDFYIDLTSIWPEDLRAKMQAIREKWFAELGMWLEDYNGNDSVKYRQLYEKGVSLEKYPWITNYIGELTSDLYYYGSTPTGFVLTFDTFDIEPYNELVNSNYDPDNPEYDVVLKIQNESTSKEMNISLIELANAEQYPNKGDGTFYIGGTTDIYRAEISSERNNKNITIYDYRDAGAGMYYNTAISSFINNKYFRSEFLELVPGNNRFHFSIYTIDYGWALPQPWKNTTLLKCFNNFRLSYDILYEGV